MQSIVVDAHGKINLTLDVLRRREDGYHDIKVLCIHWYSRSFDY